MVLSPTDILNLLQKSIQGKLEDNVPRTTPLLDVLKKNSGVTPLANGTFYITEWVEDFSNVGQFALGSTLTGGSAENVQPVITSKNLFADVVAHEKTILSMSKVPKGSLVDFVKSQTDRMERAIAREMNRTFFGNAAGVVARANGLGTASTSLTVKALDADTSDLTGVRYIKVGDFIKIGTEAAVQVTARAGAVLTLASARTWAADDNILKASEDGAVAVEMQGLKGLIVNTGTIQGINVANYPNLQSYVDTTAATISSVGEKPMQRAYLETFEQKVSNKMVGFANISVFNQWASVLTALKKTANTSEVIKGGLEVQGDVQTMPYLDFMGGKVYMDIDAWTKHWFSVDPESLTIGDLGDGVKFATSPDGQGVWSRITAKSPQYEATLRFYGELIVKNPGANSVCTNLS
jgi:hypothetical protein